MARESYSVSEAARLLGLSAPTVRRMAAEGELDSFQTPGGHLRITQESLQAVRQGHKEKREATGPSPVLRNRRERVEELALEAQELRAKREIARLEGEEQAEALRREQEAEAEEHQAERDAEAVELRRERLRLQEARERERRERERELVAFRARWLHEAEKILRRFDCAWFSAAQRQQALETCEAEISRRQVADEPRMAAIIERAISATVEPWQRDHEDRERWAGISKSTLWKLPSAATEPEKARAAGLIRQALEKLPASTAEFELRAAAEEAVAGLCRAIRRRELTQEVGDWAVLELPWGATEADKNSLRRECLEAFAELPEDISEAEARAELEGLVRDARKEIEGREARAECQRRKAQLVAQGVAEVDSYLLELKREREISSKEFWDSYLTADLKRAVQDALEEELGGDERVEEVREIARDVVDDELG